MKILLYGFTAYDRFSENITEQIIRSLPKIDGVATRVFNVEFDRAMFERALKRIKPDIIIGMGQHPRARKIRIERRARNEWATRKMRKPKTIEKGRPGSLRMSLKLPIGEGACVTYDAGTYVCNFSMFISESYALTQGAEAAFLHIPRNLGIREGVRFVTALLRKCLNGD